MIKRPLKLKLLETVSSSAQMTFDITTSLDMFIDVSKAILAAKETECIEEFDMMAVGRAIYTMPKKTALQACNILSIGDYIFPGDPDYLDFEFTDRTDADMGQTADDLYADVIDLTAKASKAFYAMFAWPRMMQCLQHSSALDDFIGAVTKVSADTGEPLTVYMKNRHFLDIAENIISEIEKSDTATSGEKQCAESVMRTLGDLTTVIEKQGAPSYLIGGSTCISFKLCADLGQFEQCAKASLSDFPDDPLDDLWDNFNLSERFSYELGKEITRIKEERGIK